MKTYIIILNIVQEDQTSTQHGRLKEMEEERTRLQRAQSAQLQQLDKYKSMVDESREKLERSEAEVTRLKRVCWPFKHDLDIRHLSKNCWVFRRSNRSFLAFFTFFFYLLSLFFPRTSVLAAASYNFFCPLFLCFPFRNFFASSFYHPFSGLLPKPLSLCICFSSIQVNFRIS